MTTEYHPLLCVIQNLITRAAPDPRWPAGDAVCIGVAAPLGPQWLTATRDANRIVVALGDEAPETARARLVIKESAADKMLGGVSDKADIELPRHVTDGDDSRLLGDADFFKVALVSALGSDSMVGLRVREVSHVR